LQLFVHASKQRKTHVFKVLNSAVQFLKKVIQASVAVPLNAPVCAVGAHVGDTVATLRVRNHRLLAWVKNITGVIG
jgi:hypothetical protein